ncbi:ABC transporter substrate-binding protein [Paenibacillus senegalensis]|uniref:ABC transporter substrate-binding protein n=1 Tax=Paenibacillus senegalensis TaxID=1465766 RepID=UPI000288783D|nr:ABC transporter substrate-binding protein [Paenibacillus senegalensis]
MVMTRGKKKIAAGVLISIVLTACGSNAGSESGTNGQGNANEGQVTLQFMVTSENYSGRLKDFIANYEEMSGNRVDVQLFPAAEFDNMLKVKMMSDEGPDLFVTDDIAMSQFQVPVEWFEDLTERPWAERLSDGGRAIIEWNDGRITGLPITNPGGMGMMYNKAIFDELGLSEPTTWDELLQLSETLKQAGVTPINIQLANGSEFGTTHLMHQLFANAELNRGSQIWDELNSNKLKLVEVEEYEQALQQMLELKEKGYINEDFISNTFEMTQEKLGTGQVAMHPGGDFILEPLLENYPDIELGFFPMPFGDTPGVISLYAGVGMSVNSNAKNKEAALELIDFFATKEEQEAYMGKAPGTSVFADVEAEQNMISEELQKYMDSGRAFMGMFGRFQVWNDMDARKLMQEMMLGSKSPQRVLEELDAKAELLGRGKQLPGW